jgi:hypothetical protein
MARKKETQVTFNGVVLPAAFASVTRTLKALWGAKWVLTTQNGSFMALFSSEEQLDAWWREFQQSQGREPFPSKLRKKLNPRRVPKSVRLPVRRAGGGSRTSPTLTQPLEGSSLPDWDFD